MVHDSKWFYWIFKNLAVFWKEKEKVIGIECVEECEEERERGPSMKLQSWRREYSIKVMIMSPL